MASQKDLKVSIWRDILFAALVASFTFGAWVGIYVCFGETSKLDSGFVTFIGGVLAISGLLFRQYMLKEVLDYLKAWDHMSDLLNTIIESAIRNGHTDNSYTKLLSHQLDQSLYYGRYVRCELTLVPVVPIVLIFLYGCAFLSENSIELRLACLYIMIFLVAYLAVAAVSSTRLACTNPDLEKTINDLEILRQDLDK